LPAEKKRLIKGERRLCVKCVESIEKRGGCKGKKGPCWCRGGQVLPRGCHCRRRNRLIKENVMSKQERNSGEGGCRQILKVAIIQGNEMGKVKKPRCKDAGRAIAREKALLFKKEGGPGKKRQENKTGKKGGGLESCLQRRTTQKLSSRKREKKGARLAPQGQPTPETIEEATLCN